jgi:hypothetical protein
MFVLLGRTGIAVNIDHVTHIWPTADGCAVYVLGREKPIQDYRSVEDLLAVTDVETA